MEQIEQTSLDLLSMRAKCDDQEKELEKYRAQLNKNEICTHSHITSITAQLIDKEETVNKLHSEVCALFLKIFQKKIYFYFNFI